MFVCVCEREGSRLNNRSLYFHKDTPKVVYKSQEFDNMAFEYKFKITKI